MTNNSRNYIFLGVAILLLLAVVYAVSHHGRSSVSSGVATSGGVIATSSGNGTSLQSGSTTPANPVSLPPFHFRGNIDLKGVGGTGLTVSTGRAISQVGDGGVFAVLPLAEKSLTVVTVSDNASKPRAYAIAFPDTTYLVINASSTAEATLIDPTADVTTGKKELATIDTLSCFPAYVSYLRKELPVHSIDEIQKATDPNDTSNPHNVCLKEIQAYAQRQTSSLH